MKQPSNIPLAQAFPPSPSCDCEICKSYCRRPGWWTVEEAANAIKAGFGPRMMLEVSGDLKFGVLSPAFRGCEGSFALKEFSHSGCCFLRGGLCRLHGTGHQPLECRFCHHDRQGLEQKCHEALETDWKTAAGKQLVQTWALQMGLWRWQGFGS